MLAGPHLLLAALALSAPDSARVAAGDSVPTRVVRTLETFTVRGLALHDPLSTETVHRVPPGAIRRFPVERIAGLVALEPGVVAQGEDLNVRGGRAGDLATVLDGVSLNEPIRGKPLDVPLLALRDAELATGGLDADFGGSLAGALMLRTLDPAPRWERALEWHTAGGFRTKYDRVTARAGGPLGGTGFGAIATVDAALDDTPFLAPRNHGRTRVLGTTWGWRADNRLLGHAKIVARPEGARVSLETLVSRRVTEPFDPAWTLDGYVNLCPDPDTCYRGPDYSATPKPAYFYYHGADHALMTDERRMVSILAWQRLSERRRLGAALSWARSASVTSLDGRDDQSYLVGPNLAIFGPGEGLGGEPLYVHFGNAPYFRRARSDEMALQAQWQTAKPRGDQVKAGATLLYDVVDLRELDLTRFADHLDSLRRYHAGAPGGSAYVHARWVLEGMAANAGLRLEYFTAGREAERQSLPAPVRGFWTLSPRLGIAYPLSVSDVFSLSYVRVSQNPQRDFLYDNRTHANNRVPIGNPALEPATLISYQVALKHLMGTRWSFQASLFYRDLFGIIGAHNTQPDRDVPRMVYESEDEAHAVGWELSAIRIEGERSRLELHYTWLDALGTYSREEGVPYGPRLRARPESLGEHPLDWDRRHSIALLAEWRPRDVSIAWTTAVGSPLPWTPHERRALDTDFSQENAERLDWVESSALALRWSPPVASRRLVVGVDVTNVFGSKNEIAATVDGYPNPAINTVYDDYGAYRHETGHAGGAYWNDRDGDGVPGWVPVNDPRLFNTPRQMRAFVGMEW